ncbi:hypothetical protein NEUTE2DRAFT_81112 [Neurospora tetrasperma FGSC 2509]|nr:hypothetical protein NEUTE2DRAFT_81112 [Neurospora tetrasperma FGSC 2509]
MHPPLSDGSRREGVTLRGRVSLSFWDRGGEQQKDSLGQLPAGTVSDLDLDCDRDLMGGSRLVGLALDR